MTITDLNNYQPEAVALLKRAIKRGRLSHALIFASPGDVGESETALLLSQFLLCEKPVDTLQPCNTCPSCKLFNNGMHPDLHEVKPKGLLRAIRTDDMLNVIQSLQTTSHSGIGKVVVIHQAETLRKESANRFLKTLEEPTSKTYFILLTSRVERLLPTIISRCQTLRFKPFTDELIRSKAGDELNAHHDDLDLICSLSAGRWRRAVQLSNDIGSYKHMVKQLSNILINRDNASALAVTYASSISMKLKKNRDEFNKYCKSELSAKIKELIDVDTPIKKEIISQLEMQLKSEQAARERDEKAGILEALDALWRDVLTYKMTGDAESLLHRFIKTSIIQLAGKYTENEIIRNLENITLVRGPTVYLNARLDTVLQGVLAQSASKSSEFDPLRSAISATGL